MSLKTVFLLSAVVSGFFALVSLLIPVTMLSWYGPIYTDTLVMMTRYFGVGLLAIAFVSFFLKDAELTKEVKSVVLALIISDIVGFVVSLWATTTNILNNFGWLNVIIYGFFTIALYSVYKKK
ncbi:hypothetical protein ACFL0J_06240 [Candidatus Neomarinimicrobiota bacterium]